MSIKKYILRGLLIIGAVFVVLCAIVFYSFYRYLKEPNQTTVEVFEEALTKKLAIPVQIEDSTYYFLWDTGSESSSIDSLVGDRLGIHFQDTTLFHTYITSKREVEDNFVYKKVNLKIGDFAIDSWLLLEGDRFVALRDPLKGIIGQNIISRYYWLFDFQDSTVTLSKEPIPIVSDREAMHFSFRLHRDTTGIPVVGLQLDTLPVEDFYLDTGMPGSFAFQQKIFSYPVFYLTEDLARRLPLPINHRIELGNEQDATNAVLFKDSLIINQFSFSDLSMLDHQIYPKGNIITVNFIYQFNQMYYDPFVKEITLIGYRGVDDPIGDEKEMIFYLDSLKREHDKKQ